MRHTWLFDGQPSLLDLVAGLLVMAAFVWLHVPLRPGTVVVAVIFIGLMRLYGRVTQESSDE